MADNQYINKIQYGNQVLIDLTNDTVDASSLLAGVMAHGADGSIVTGELELSYHVTLHQAQYDQLTTAQKQLANTWYYIDDANNVGVSIADNVIANSKVWSSLKTNAEIQKAKDIAGNGYDTTHTYNTGDYCIYNDEFYVCTDDDVTGTWDSTKWDETTIAEVLSSMSGGTAFISKTQSQYESLPSSEKNDPTKFYYITDTTVSGAPLDDNSSSNGKVWSAQKIGNELASRDSDITALNSKLSHYKKTTGTGSATLSTALAALTDNEYLHSFISIDDGGYNVGNHLLRPSDLRSGIRYYYDLLTPFNASNISISWAAIRNNSANTFTYTQNVQPVSGSYTSTDKTSNIGAWEIYVAEGA